MRTLALGATGLAVLVLVSLYLFHSQDTTPFFLLIIAASVGVWFCVGLYRDWQRSRSWLRVDATIVSCSKEWEPEDGVQEYKCVYRYLVDGVPAAGFISLHAEPDNLAELERILLGRVITVLYNPKDCTQSAVQCRRIDQWDIWQSFN